MAVNTFKSQSVSNYTRHTLLVQNFVGVDLTTPQTMLNSQRLSKSSNYVLRGNLPQKRFGRTRVGIAPKVWYLPLSFSGERASSVVQNANRINGLWSFQAEDGKSHTVAHVGKLLYEVVLNDGAASFTLIKQGIYAGTDSDNVPLCYEFLDGPSMAFSGQGKLWFLGGTKYCAVRFTSNGASVEPVADSDFAFVPTTTISITYADAITNARNGLDYPNLMSRYRRNGLITGIGKSASDSESKTTFYEYTLDAPIVYETEADMAGMLETMEYKGEVDD